MFWSFVNTSHNPKFNNNHYFSNTNHFDKDKVFEKKIEFRFWAWVHRRTLQKQSLARSNLAKDTFACCVSFVKDLVHALHQKEMLTCLRGGRGSFNCVNDVYHFQDLEPCQATF